MKGKKKRRRIRDAVDAAKASRDAARKSWRAAQIQVDRIADDAGKAVDDDTLAAAPGGAVRRRPHTARHDPYDSIVLAAILPPAPPSSPTLLLHLSVLTAAGCAHTARQSARKAARAYRQARKAAARRHVLETVGAATTAADASRRAYHAAGSAKEIRCAALAIRRRITPRAMADARKAAEALASAESREAEAD